MEEIVVGGGEHALGERLAELERVVEAGVAGFLAAGLALHQIRTERLYLTTAGSWAEYLRVKWNMSVQSAWRVEGAARCSRAIEGAGMELPSNASPELLRPLSSVLRRGGEQGVADAWRLVQEHHDDGRPLSGERVRAILARHGEPTTAADKRRTPLKPISCSTSRALTRARALQADYANQVPPATVRSRAAALAGEARELSDVLNQLADTGAAAVRLAALEPAGPDLGPLRGRLGAQAERAAFGRDALARLVRAVVVAEQAGDMEALHGELLDGAAQLLAWADYLERRAAVELAAELADLEATAA